MSCCSTHYKTPAVGGPAGQVSLQNQIWCFCEKGQLHEGPCGLRSTSQNWCLGEILMINLTRGPCGASLSQMLPLQCPATSREPGPILLTAAEHPNIGRKVLSTLWVYNQLTSYFSPLLMMTQQTPLPIPLFAHLFQNCCRLTF